MPSGLVYLNSLDRSISNRGAVWLVFIIIMFIEIPVLKTNGTDPDQTPRSAASDMGLHCLSMSLLCVMHFKTVMRKSALFGFLVVKVHSNRTNTYPRQQNLISSSRKHTSTYIIV